MNQPDKDLIFTDTVANTRLDRRFSVDYTATRLDKLQKWIRESSDTMAAEVRGKLTGFD